jgi:hypothetical protein
LPRTYFFLKHNTKIQRKFDLTEILIRFNLIWICKGRKEKFRFSCDFLKILFNLTELMQDVILRKYRVGLDYSKSLYFMLV